METKVLKFIMLICLSTEVSIVWAGQPLFDDWTPGSVLEESQNSNVWDKEKSHMSSAIWPQNNKCISGNGCAVVKSVFQDYKSEFKCVTTNNFILSCQELIENFGINVKGFSIKIDVPYSDEVTADNIVYCIPNYDQSSSSQFCH